jgi:hypothetical protein
MVPKEGIFMCPTNESADGGKGGLAGESRYLIRRSG